MNWHMMDDRFREHIKLLPFRYAQLLSMKPVTVEKLPRVMPQQGIYLFSDGDVHQYVGRTDRMRCRLQEHCRPASSHHKAAFAFRLARVATRRPHASYAKSDSRAALQAEPGFLRAFQDAKIHIRNMSVRFIEEKDPVSQNLQEVYVAVVSGALYSDFNNH